LKSQNFGFQCTGKKFLLKQGWGTEEMQCYLGKTPGMVLDKQIKLGKKAGSLEKQGMVLGKQTNLGKNRKGCLKNQGKVLGKQTNLEKSVT